MSKYFELPVILTIIFYCTSSIVSLKAFYSLSTTLGNHKCKL